ncbi:Regulator of nonsense transcripts 1 [Mycena kentingensis (nom. inval.)]|nr:Regulator of nonsense transcripts 1 [Mycena kentingensis (nom. inval.)]
MALAVIVQDVFKAVHPPIQLAQYPDYRLKPDVLDDFLATATDGVLGLAPSYNNRSRLSALALATSERVLVVTFSYKDDLTHTQRKRLLAARQLIHNRVFLSAQFTKFALRMDTLATSLFLDLELHIGNAVDLLSVAFDNSRHSVAALIAVFGGEQGIDKPKLVSLFSDQTSVFVPYRSLGQQAWAIWRAATLASMQEKLNVAPRIQTRLFSDERLRVLGRLIRTARGMDFFKPTRVENEIDVEFSHKGNRLQVTSTRFKTRILRSNNQRVEVESTVQGKSTTFSGKTKFVDGRAAQIALTEDFQGDTIRVTTVGREDPTKLEQRRELAILRGLQQSTTLLDHPFFQAIWLPSETPCWARVPGCGEHKVSLYYPHAQLNGSQRDAVNAILSEDDCNRVMVVQGPPGAGKTTVIAAAILSILSSADEERTVWVVAQSNVAVKNIAEKLARVDCNFTLLVSKEFVYSWHEHLYEKIAENVVRSDEISDDYVALERRLYGSRVVLCTLSMLSNYSISIITRVIPFQTLIVDEASQIEVGAYLPLLERFMSSIRKLVFIGDDKQLPPHGASKVEGLQSIFELEHLRRNAIFLDTQYRFVACQVFPRHSNLDFPSMPEHLGAFIGEHVYNGKLKTAHDICDPCCRFIDTAGKEEARGSSWINVEESKAVLAQARRFEAMKRSYRVLTPYDAQRALLEKTLKDAELLWQNRVFCVDSFQGNEDDYIIVSIVRTESPGFLRDARRVNVMLTRCRMGMVLCANRRFVEGVASDTLVGKLAEAADDWVTWTGWR